MKLHIGALVSSVIGFLFLANCKSGPDVATIQEAASGQKCQFYIPPSVKDDFDKSKDTFKTMISSVSACSRTGNRFKDIVDMLNAAGCQGPLRRIVSEEAQFADMSSNLNGVRFVDSFDCGTRESTGNRLGDQIFMAGIGPITSKVEIIGFDSEHQSLSFYTQNVGPAGSSDFVFHGTSFHMADKGEMTTGTPANHPCSNCHQNGTLLMKELRSPWVNWHSPPFLGGFAFGGGAGFINVDEVFKRLSDAQGVNATLNLGESFEQDVKKTTLSIIAERIRRIQASEPFPQPPMSVPQPLRLRALLKPLFCENEINLNGSGLIFSDTIDSSDLSPDLFINKLLLPVAEEIGPAVFTPTGPGPAPLSNDIQVLIGIGKDPGNSADIDFRRVVIRRLDLNSTAGKPKRFGVSHWVPASANGVGRYFDDHNLRVPASGSDTEHRFGRFALTVPSRSFSDDMFISALVDAGILEERLVTSALMVDFPNPLFSSQRCSLLTMIPDAALSAMTGTDQKIDPKQITAAVQTALATHTEPQAKEFTNNLTKSPHEHALRVKNYLTSCNGGVNRLTNSPDHTYRIIRAKIQKLFERRGEFALEPFVFKMFMQADELANDRFADEADAGITEECAARGL